jgi:hypothetical protein
MAGDNAGSGLRAERQECRRPDVRTLLTPVVQGPRSPIGFYLRFGFSRTGQVFDGEDVLELRLDEPDSAPAPDQANCFSSTGMTSAPNSSTVRRASS